MAEILGWCDKEVKEASWGENYFNPRELQQDGQRTQVMVAALERLWGARIARLFQQAWQSTALAECPTLGEWLVALPLEPLSSPVQPAETNNVIGEDIALLVMKAERAVHEGKRQNALELYCRAESKAKGEMHSEIQARIVELQTRRNTWACPICGKDVSVDLYVCPYCETGKREPQAEQKPIPKDWICPFCGKTVPANLQLCPYCEGGQVKLPSSKKKFLNFALVMSIILAAASCLGLVGVLTIKLGEQGVGPLAYLASPTNTITPTSTVTLTITSTYAMIITLEAPTPTLETTEVPAPSVVEDTSSSNSEMVSDQDGMVMVYVPEGEFEMGSVHGYPDELPVHQVYLDSFWIDLTEVTNAMFAYCVASGECKKPECGYFDQPDMADYPVVCVDWNQAKTYCEWAGRELPTEAEWVDLPLG
jgi:hypothetical protein